MHKTDLDEYAFSCNLLRSCTLLNRRVFPIKISGSGGWGGRKNYGHVIIYTGIRVGSTGRGSALRARNILKFSSGERDNGPAERGPHTVGRASHVKINFDPKTMGDRGCGGETLYSTCEHRE